MLQRKIMLELTCAVRHIVHRSNAVRRLACFLDVSSLNLAALQGAATFFVLNGPEFMVRCKNSLASALGHPYIVHCSIAVRRVVCFLDVSSLNLAALQSAASFFTYFPQGSPECRGDPRRVKRL